VKRSPIMRRTQISRRTGVKAANARRVRGRRLEAFGTDARVSWWRGLPCACKGLHPSCSRGWSDPTHVTSTGAGGKAHDIIPLSRRCHTEQHAHGWIKWHTLAQLPLEYAAELAEQLSRLGPDAPGCGP